MTFLIPTRTFIFKVNYQLEMNKLQIIMKNIDNSSLIDWNNLYIMVKLFTINQANNYKLILFLIIYFMSEQLKTLRPPQNSPFPQVDFSSLLNYEPNIKSSQKTNETSKIRDKYSPNMKHFTNKPTYKQAKNYLKCFNNEQKVDSKNRPTLASSTILEPQHQRINNVQISIQHENKCINQTKRVFSPTLKSRTTTFYSNSPNNNKKYMSPKRNFIRSPTNQNNNFNQKQICPKQKLQIRCPTFFKKAKIAEQIKKQIQSSQNKKIFNLTMMDFKFVKFLGQGTFGDVYLAVHKKTNSLFTIKRYRKDTLKQHQLQQKFIRDIKIQLKINHPNIVKMYGFFDDQTFIYIIFQFMEQGNLWKLIQQKGGNISQAQITIKLTQINGALIYLHQQKLIHRDIKPQSILVCHNLCKLCDTQWIQGLNQKFQNAVLCRQIDYTAPEALQGKQINTNFDVWGLGLIAFQMVTGKKLFNAVTQKGILRKIITIKSQIIQKQLPQRISSKLKQFIVQALNPVPTKRITSIQIEKLQIFKKHVKERKWLGQQGDECQQQQA